MVVAANHRGWGWPGAPDSAADRKYRKENLTRLLVGGIVLPINKEVAPLFEGFIEELLDGGYVLDGNTPDDWGYANRDIRGAPGVKSNHAWGLAVDLNATTNPMTNDGRNHTDLPPGVSKMAARYGLEWGGDYSGRKDPMHFEFTGSRRDAQVRVTLLRSRPTLVSRPKPTQTHLEQTVAALISEDMKKVYGFDGVRTWHVPNPDTLRAVKVTGVYGDGKVHQVPVGTIKSLEATEKV